IPWTKVAEIGNKLRIPHTPRISSQNNATKYVSEIIFKSRSFESEMLNCKAASIVSQSLTTGSFLFTFPPGTFVNHIAAYKAIQDTFGKVAEFQHLSGYTPNPNKQDMLIEARFESKDSKQKAITTGITVRERTFLDTSTRESTVKSFVHVALTLLHNPTSEDVMNQASLVSL
ncbi:uncharacterized protein B0P05DRAFT_459722, partial [Gilbertella persicaria]|uniref:uncharacterized protein n=1 Tax=Gilbertella persicaria TaxID=101096 RepID=UPI0022202AD2